MDPLTTIADVCRVIQVSAATREIFSYIGHIQWHLSWFEWDTWAHYSCCKQSLLPCYWNLPQIKQCLCRFPLEVSDIFRRQDRAAECTDHDTPTFQHWTVLYVRMSVCTSTVRMSVCTSTVWFNLWQPIWLVLKERRLHAKPFSIQLVIHEISSHTCMHALLYCPSMYIRTLEAPSQAHTYSHNSPLLCGLHCPTWLISSHPMWKYWSGNRLLISCSNLSSTLHVFPYTNNT